MSRGTIKLRWLPNTHMLAGTLMKAVQPNSVLELFLKTGFFSLALTKKQEGAEQHRQVLRQGQRERAKARKKAQRTVAASTEGMASVHLRLYSSNAIVESCELGEAMFTEEQGSCDSRVRRPLHESSATAESCISHLVAVGTIVGVVSPKAQELELRFSGRELHLSFACGVASPIQQRKGDCVSFRIGRSEV